MEGFKALAADLQGFIFFALVLLGYLVLFLFPVRERRTMWNFTLMVVLTSLSAALYAAILIPFKILPIIPGVTEVRPANAIPIVCSLLFGPAGAWGSGIGNFIGDLFFGFGPGSLFGLVGNFLYGLIPYVFWRAMVGSRDPDPKRKGDWAILVFICAVASATCALTIAYAIDVALMGIPFATLGMIIFWNNFLMAVILAPPLLFSLLPRVRAWGLHFTMAMPGKMVVRPRLAWLGVVLVTLGSLGGLAAGFGIDTRLYGKQLWMPAFVKSMQAPPALSETGKASASRQVSAPARGPAAPRQSLADRRFTLAFGLLPALLAIAAGILLL